MDNFVFSNTTKVYFGKGAVKDNLPQLLSHYGKTVLLGYGGGSIKRNGIYEEIIGTLQEAGKTIVEFSGIMSNPTYAKVQEGAALVRKHGIDFILAVGGGSVSDCCKIVAAQARLDEDLWTFEKEKKGKPTEFVPMGTIVTVFGTGSEMNARAVITHEEKMLKAGLDGGRADFAMLDPCYSLTVPFQQVISGAFDTLSHYMEVYFGKPEKDNLTDEISESLMRNTVKNIRILMKDRDNYDARSELAWDSALAESRLVRISKLRDFQCHQIEHQLGAYTNCNHGAGLAVLHPVLYRHLYPYAPYKFACFAQRVMGVAPQKTDLDTAKAGVEALAAFIKEIGLPTNFRELGIPADTDLRAVANSTNISDGCCKALTADEIYQILLECK